MGQPNIPTAVSTAFYRKLGTSNFIITSVEEKQNKVYKIVTKCLQCECKGTTKSVIGDNKSTGNFVKHLKLHHPEEHENLEKQRQNIKRQKLEGQSTLDKYKIANTSGKKATLDKLTLRYIINSMLPLSTVEDKNFRDLLRGALGVDSITFMDRKSLKTKIYEDLTLIQTAIFKQIEETPICCLTADLWSSRSRSYLGVTAHWLSADLRRHKATLACRRFKGAHTYDKIALELNRVMSQFSISTNKVVAVITDNGSNFVKAFKEFGLDFEEEETDEANKDCDDDDEGDNHEMESVAITDSLDKGQDSSLLKLPSHVRCVAHTLNLVATTDVKKVTEKGIFHRSMGKCIKLFNLSNSPKSADTIRTIIGKDLKRPTATRWNSLYDAVKYLLADDVVVHLNKLCTELYLAAFQTTEIDFLNECIKISEPLAIALDILQGEDNVYFGNLLPTIKGLLKNINQLKSKLQFTSAFASAMIDGIQKRFSQILNYELNNPSDFVYAAMSHPYFKLRWIEPDKREILKNVFTERCIELAGKKITDTTTIRKYGY